MSIVQQSSNVVKWVCYNANGFSSSKPYIENLIKEYDVVCISELGKVDLNYQS